MVRFIFSFDHHSGIQKDPKKCFRILPYPLGNLDRQTYPNFQIPRKDYCQCCQFDRKIVFSSHQTEYRKLYIMISKNVPVDLREVILSTWGWVLIRVMSLSQLIVCLFNI